MHEQIIILQFQTDPILLKTIKSIKCDGFAEFNHFRPIFRVVSTTAHGSNDPHH